MSNRQTVFISYNHDNSDVVLKLRDFLEENAINVIIDESMQGGDSITDFIQNSISKSDFTISIVSNKSLKSGWVGIETVDSFFRSKYRKKKTFIACYLDESFFKDDFTSRAVEELDLEINKLKEIADKHHAQKLDTSDIDAKRTRLYKLRNNLSMIIGHLRNTLCIDIRYEKFDENKNEILETILKGYSPRTKSENKIQHATKNDAKEKFTKPKRILAIDGGGIRALISIGILSNIEKTLQKRYEDSKLRLCDYYDLIGGTSTGGIVAAMLAKGMSTEEILIRLKERFPYIYRRKRNFFFPSFRSVFDEKPLKSLITDVFGSMPLLSEDWKTGLCVPIKRLNPSSLWFATNMSTGKYYNATKRMLISDVLMASTASPSFFKPKKLTLENGVETVFVDGGLSTASNPALHLFLLAVNSEGNLNWQTGENNLMLTSIGTGIWPQSIKHTNPSILQWASQMPEILSYDINLYNQLILQGLSNSLTARQIDMEWGNFRGCLMSNNPLLNYLRYDVDLTEHGLNELGLSKLHNKIEYLRSSSQSEHIDSLIEIGIQAGKKYVIHEHFPISTK